MTTVSIIIPSFRQPQFLGRAIESCLEQDHEDIEVVVIDDRSRDASLAVAWSFASADDRVKVFEAAANGGLGAARNVGIAHASGEYLCFLDSDDYLVPGSLSARLEVYPAAELAHGEDLAVVYGDWQHVGEMVDHLTPRNARASMPTVSTANYTGENVFICSAPLVRRDHVLAVGGFPENLPMLEDFALWARMIAAGHVFEPVHHVVATYRQRPNSMLRGDGATVMAAYVDRINAWMETEQVELADGGAMSTWLENGSPNAHGRLSWNVPSQLGNLGSTGVPVAGAPNGGIGDSGVPDFMADPTVTGLSSTLSPLPSSVESQVEAQRQVIVRSPWEALEAVALRNTFDAGEMSLAVFVEDPHDWASWWPLALDGVLPDAASQLSEGHPTIDLKTLRVETPGLARRGAEHLWPDLLPAPDSAIVYVPESMRGYAALDAWISVTLHALGDAGLSSRLMVDPSMRGEIGGWRTEFLSIESMLEADVVVCPDGPQEFLTQLATVVVFDPSVIEEGPARTAAELAARLDVVGRSESISPQRS